jgi:hypothetical protein
MAWGSTKARVRGKIQSGGFAKKPDYDFLQTGANIIAQGMLDAKERKLEADKLAKEKAEENAEKQAAKEKEAADRKRKAESLAKEFGADPKNNEAITYFTEQLFFFDDNTSSVYDKAESDVKRGKIKFVPKKEELFLQGPDVPRDFPLTVSPDGKKPLSKFSSGKALTAGNVGNFVSIPDEDGNETNPYKTEGDQMAAIFAPISEQPSKTNTFEGLEIDPDAKEPIELDYQRLTTLDDIDLYVGEIKSKGQTLTDDQQTVIDNRTDLLNGRRVDAAITDAVKDEKNAKSALMALEAKVTQAGTEDEKNRITDSYEYKAIKGFVERFALGEAYEVPLQNLKTSQDVELELLFISLNKKNVPKGTMDILREYKARYTKQEKEAELKENQPTLSEQISIINLDDDGIAELAKITANSNDPKTQMIYEYATLLKEAASGKDINVSEYLGNMGSVNATKNRIIEIKNDTTLTKDEKAKILAVMEPHLVELQQSAKKLKLTDTDYIGDVVIDAQKGIVQKQELVLTENGEFFSPLLQKTFSSDEVQNAISVDAQETLMSNATRLQDNAFAKMGDHRKNMSDLLRRAKNIDDIVQTTDGEILTFVGGRFPAIMKRIENEVGSLNTLLSGSSTGTINSVVENAINAEMQEQSQQLDKIGINAQEFAEYQSRLIEFAFTYARTGLGQVRTTDQDFNAAVKVVSAGSDYPTFSRNLRGLVKQAFAMNQEAHDGYLVRPDVDLAANTVGAKEVYAKFLIPMSEYLQNQVDVPEAITWMNTEVQQGPAPQKNPNQVLNQYLNSDAYKNDMKKVNEFKIQEDQEIFINMIARRLKLSPSIVRSQLLKKED